MKKFIKWFIFGVVVSGGLALAICYMVIPQETKSAIDIVVGYLNTPLGIVGGTTITLGMVVFIVVSNLLKINREKTKESFEECKHELELKEKEIDDKILAFNQSVEDYLKQHEDKIEEIKGIETEIIDTIKLIPNKKVQERLEKLYGQKDTND